MKYLAVLAAIGLAGCGQAIADLGNGGKNPGAIACKGSVALSGNGTANLNAGLGGTGTNNWSLVGDCHEGVVIVTGTPEQVMQILNGAVQGGTILPQIPNPSAK